MFRIHQCNRRRQLCTQTCITRPEYYNGYHFLHLWCNHDSTGTNWHWVHLRPSSHRCELKKTNKKKKPSGWPSKLLICSDGTAKNKTLCWFVAWKKLSWQQVILEKEKWGRPRGHSCPWVLQAEGLWGSVVSQEGLNAQWEIKPLLTLGLFPGQGSFWVFWYRQHIERKKITTKWGRKKETPPPKKTRDSTKKKRAEKAGWFPPQSQKHFKWQALLSTELWGLSDNCYCAAVRAVFTYTKVVCCAISINSSRIYFPGDFI